MNDNLARVLVREDYDELRLQQVERSRKKAQVKRNGFIRSAVGVAITAILAFGVITGNMRVCELERSIADNNTKLSILQNSNEQKAVALEGAMSLEEIETYAKTRLGMNKPANNQIIYLNIHNNDTSKVID